MRQGKANDAKSNDDTQQKQNNACIAPVPLEA